MDKEWHIPVGLPTPNFSNFFNFFVEKQVLNQTRFNLLDLFINLSSLELKI